MAEFSKIFDAEVLKPQFILPVKRATEDWKDLSCWEDLSDVNRKITMFDFTVEECSNVMTVFAEGYVEVHNPANYKGAVHGENICVSENGGMLMISIPTNIKNYMLTAIKMMNQGEMVFKGEPNRMILFEYPMMLGVNLMPFKVQLQYKFN